MALLLDHLFIMDRIYFTVTGTCYYHGKESFKKDMQVKLVKEPDNAFDREAIKAELEGLGILPSDFPERSDL